MYLNVLCVKSPWVTAYVASCQSPGFLFCESRKKNKFALLVADDLINGHPFPACLFHDACQPGGDTFLPHSLVIRRCVLN